MFDWKILAASFAALLVVSSVLVGGFGFGDILEKLNEWMGDSPLGGFVSTPSRESQHVLLSVSSESLDIPLDAVDFTAGGALFEGFIGTLQTNASSGNILLSPQDSSLRVTLSAANLTIDGVTLTNLALDSADFSVTSNSLETSGEGVPFEVQDFSGSITVGQGSVVMDGNVTAVKGNNKDIV